MSPSIFHVDAFTSRPFAGNPAAVCILTESRDASWMQNVARDQNLSETAFVQRRPTGFDLRWFTPKVEVDLCGHATLASAHILWETGQLEAHAKAIFHTRSGQLTAERRGGKVELNFPAGSWRDGEAPPLLIEAMRVEPVHVAVSRLGYLLQVESENMVRDLEPNMDLLRKTDTHGVIVTSAAHSPGFDFVSRYFAPSVGIDEDPVTGSAHCVLGPYWASRLKKREMVAFQASARGGVVEVRVVDDRVKLCGSAVTVMRGELVSC